ncbi:hypothetical protein RD792_006757 [Penstemon davidsonii]|uniref:BED-type domain-containing protein n=1 Tax=Penstemon davidsonii TaxID=160366 RepID=A0ABR0DBQ2_9LAMI|nr:hypothetical protein RD792_006757 [Penstemon davidsonii]
MYKKPSQSAERTEQVSPRRDFKCAGPHRGEVEAEGLTAARMSSSGSGRPPLHPNIQEQIENARRPTMGPPQTSISTPSQTISSPIPTLDSSPVPPPEVSEEQGQTSKKKAKAWQHFTEYKRNGKVKAQCKYCDKSYACESGKNGTSGLNKHMAVCQKHLDNIVNSTHDSHTIHSFCHSVTGVGDDGDQREVSSL